METLRIMLGKDNVEVYSVDEAFLNLEEYAEADLQQIGIKIRETVEEWTGIKVSVGIAPTKVLSTQAKETPPQASNISTTASKLAEPITSTIGSAEVATNENQTSSLATPGGQLTFGNDCVAPIILPGVV